MNDGEQGLAPVEGTRRRYARGRKTSLWVIGAAGILAAVLVLVTSAVGKTESSHTAKPEPSTAGLAAPHDLSVYGSSDGSAVISWQPSRPIPVGYRIYRSNGLHSPFTIVGTVDAPTIDTFVDSADLTPGMTYAYKVVAFDRQHESAAAGPIMVVVIAPKATPTATVLAPLPTFAPVTDPTLTAIAQQSGGRQAPPQAQASIVPSTLTAGITPLATRAVATVQPGVHQ